MQEEKYLPFTCVQIRASKRLGCHAACHEVSRCRTEVNPLHTGDKACKPGIHLGFEIQSRHHQKSKTGVSVASQKGLMSSKNLKIRISASL